MLAVNDNKARYCVAPTSISHIYELAPRLRTGDAREIEGTGNNPKRALWRGFRNSIMCETAFVGDEIAAMWGLCVGYSVGLSLLSDIGRPWLLTSSAVEREPFAMIREARAATKRMIAVKPILENYVLASYTQAVRFILLVGFSVDEREISGVNGEKYLRFHMSR